MRPLRPVGSLIFDHLNFLKTVSKTKSEKKRAKILKRATRDQLLSIVEICTNILQENFALSKKQKLRLLPYATYIRKLASRRSEAGARNLIQQKGIGLFLPALILPIIIEASRHLIAKDLEKQ